MPCLEVMKAFTDKNIDSSNSKIRVQAFDLANELMAEAGIQILFPSQLYERIKPRLNEDQKTAFETLYRIDGSTNTAVPAFDLYQSTKIIAIAESKARSVIILTDNGSNYIIPDNHRVKHLTPARLIEVINILRALKKRGELNASLSEALLIYLFK